MARALASTARVLLVAALLLPLIAVSQRPAAALDSVEAQFLTVINTYRSEMGLPTLKLSPKMSRAAEWMSRDMGAEGYFSHTDSRGRDPFQRMAAFGYTYNTAKAENLAAGYEMAQAVFNAWLASPGHKKNIDNPKYRAIGIGRAYVEGSPYGWYWSTDFGGVMDTATSAALSNHVAKSGSTYTYTAGRDVRLSGTVVGDFAGKGVSVAVQKLVYDSTRRAYVWKAYRTDSRTLSASSAYAASLRPPVGKYRVRTSFPGGGDVKPSASAFRYFNVK